MLMFDILGFFWFVLGFWLVGWFGLICYFCFVLVLFL